jgi:hypothetical protein
MSERLQILSILPKEGNIVTLRIIRNLQMNLSPIAAEIEEYKMENVPEGVKYTQGALVPKPFELMQIEVDTIQKALKDLDNKQKLPIEMIGIYDKFFT